MAGALRKTMVYLGFGRGRGALRRLRRRRGLPGRRIAGRVARRRARPPPPRCRASRERRAPVTPIRGQLSRVVSSAAASTDLHRITTIHPRTYNEAKTIGEAFRSGTPVIMNLSDMDDSDAKRLVDFAAGLIFGLHGSIERVTNKVFLLSPAHVEVAQAEKVKVPERTFFNQS
ncbi:MAG: cell division protein SepF [Kineosporiaceae bacterium]|nr:cell division protein SepF [Kineosporiaceae bacterium]